MSAEAIDKLRQRLFQKLVFLRESNDACPEFSSRINEALSGIASIPFALKKVDLLERYTVPEIATIKIMARIKILFGFMIRLKIPCVNKAKNSFGKIFLLKNYRQQYVHRAVTSANRRNVVR